MKSILAGAISLALYVGPGLARAGTVAAPSPGDGAVQIVRYENERSQARLEPARMGGRSGLAVVFEGTNDLHYYARAETAPSPGLQLQIEAAGEGVDFDTPVFPPWQSFTDSTGKNVEVHVGNFRVFVPLRESAAAGRTETAITVKIKGMACTSELCLPPFQKTMTTTLDLSQAGSWPEMGPPPPQAKAARPAAFPHSAPLYFLLALAAGISINIMPCVLPVLPLVLMRLVDQSRRVGGRRLASGLAFSAGILGFFAVFALVSAILNLTTGAVLDLNSLFRYPPAVIVLFLAIVFFGLVMLDVVPLTLPAAVTNRQVSGSGLAGTAGMGFFAGVLSTPCSGALLGFVLVWAQTQPLLVSSAAIVLMGVGMALPYLILVSIPSLIDRLPRPGYWMEIFKKSTGFLLFFLAVKLTLAALPKEQLLNVLTYGIVFSFGAWAWAKWVDFSTPAPRRLAVRTLAVVITLGGALWLLPLPGGSARVAIDWRPYRAEVVQQAVAQNRPVLLDFMADWCTNCKVVERRVYHDPQIAELIRDKGVLAIKADTTLIDYPATTDLKAVYGEAGNVPVSIVLLPDGSREKLRGIFDKEELAQILQKLPEASTYDREEKSSAGAASAPRQGQTDQGF